MLINLLDKSKTEKTLIESCEHRQSYIHSVILSIDEEKRDREGKRKKTVSTDSIERNKVQSHMFVRPSLMAKRA